MLFNIYVPQNFSNFAYLEFYHNSKFPHFFQYVSYGEKHGRFEFSSIFTVEPGPGLLLDGQEGSGKIF